MFECLTSCCCPVAIGAVAVVVGALYFMLKGKPQERPMKKDWVKGRIYLYQMPRSYVLPSLSTFSLKLETWMRMAGLDYENVHHPQMLVKVRSREGTLPFVEVDGVEYVDSDLIINELITMKKKETMKDHLSDQQIGILRAVDKLTENSASASYSFFRYTQHFRTLMGPTVTNLTGFPVWQQNIFNYLVLPFMNTQMVKKFKNTPMGKHASEDIKKIGFADLRALSDILGDDDYFCGDRPTATDACVFSIIISILSIPIDVPHLAYIQSECTNLIAHSERIKAKYWPDWEEVTKGQQTHSNAWKKTE